MSDTERIGGRKKGTPNKDTQILMETAERLDVDPFEVILLFAKGDYEALGYTETQTRSTVDGSTYEELTISPDLRAKCAIKACDFLYPKRKSIEIKDDTKEGKGFNLAYADPKAVKS